MRRMGCTGNRVASMLLLAVANSPALAADRTDDDQSFPLATPINELRHDQWQSGSVNRTVPHISARASSIDWGTGGFNFVGQRIKSGSKSPIIDPIEHQWRRTYAADAAFWQSAANGIVVGAGAHVSRTWSGTSGGPMLTRPTKSISRSAYVGAQIGDVTSVKLIAFDEDGWSGSDTNDMVARIVNGERFARKGAAVEIGIFAIEPRVSDSDPEVKLRFENARTAFANSDATASLSFQMHF